MDTLMRSFACFLDLCLANAPADAQVVQPPKSAVEIKETDERVAYWRTTCLGDWDAATHMTPKEWRTTCERVAAERRQFLLQGSALFHDGPSALIAPATRGIDQGDNRERQEITATVARSRTDPE
jgi:hypothetical protein